MKRFIATLALITFGIGLTACSSTEEKGVKLMEEMAAVVDANKGHCDKMGDALKGIVDSNGDLLQKLNNMDKEAKDKISDELKGRMMAAGMKMMGGMMKCSQNEKVKTAMSSLK